MSNARKERTGQARKVLADTHIARPILSAIHRALATKRFVLNKRAAYLSQEEQDLIAEYEIDLEALKRVGALLERMNAKAFEALRYDLRRDIAAEIAGAYVQEAEAVS